MTVRLAEMTSPDVAELVNRGGIVVVPLGATEQHGPHMPLQTDFALAETVALRAAEAAAADGIAVAVTPPLWAGFSPHHLDFAGTVSLRAATLSALITDVAVSLWAHGFRRILFLNGHGGNANLLGAAVQSLRFEHGVRAASASYWSFALDVIEEWRRSPLGGINHACEMELSLGLSAFPELCRPELARDSTQTLTSEYFSPDLTKGAPVTTPWSFVELSPSGTIGSPECADAERGARLLEAVSDRVAAFLQEMSGWDWSDPVSVARGGAR